jgi:hypothetical protein
MLRISRVGVMAVVAFMIAPVAGGCGGGPQSSGPSSAKDKLEEVAQMLKTVAADKQGPPAKPADLAAVDPYLPTSASDLRSGELVYLWGATLSPGGTAVVAYEKKAPTDGGWVLLQDGTVKQMTAQDFQAAPKAGKK